MPVVDGRLIVLLFMQSSDIKLLSFLMSRSGCRLPLGCLCGNIALANFEKFNVVIVP